MQNGRLLAELAKQKEAAKYWHAEARREQKTAQNLADVLRSIRASINKALGEKAA